MSNMPTTRLGEIADLQAGVGFPLELQGRNYGKYPLAKVGDISRVGRAGQATLSAADHYVDEEDLRRLKARPIPAGSILFSKIGEAIRQNHRVIAGCPLLIDNNAMAAIPNACVESRFLYHFLRTVDFYGLASATTVPALRKSDLARLQVPLPSLGEQRRIAEILDKADALRAKRRAALAQLDALTQSIFAKTFLRTLDGPAVDVAPERSGLPQGWSWKLLTDVASLATGHTPDRERPDYWCGDIPWISLTDIRELDGTVARDTLQKVTSRGIENSSAVRLPAGTVCFSRTASVGFVTVMGREMATSQDFVNWVCGPEITPKYLMWALLNARRRLRALSAGSTHRTIYMRVVEQFRVLIPPLELQRVFSETTERIERLRGPVREGAAALDLLAASLQQRAFAGNL